MIRVAVVLFFVALIARGQEDSIACAPEKPVVSASETIRITAWVAAGSSPPGGHRYTWRASQGEIDGQGRHAFWEPPPAVLGDVEFTVEVERGSSGRLKCVTRVHVLAETTSRGPAEVVRMTRSRMLSPGQDEPAGYGLYSYLLLGRPDRDKYARERSLKTVQAFLDKVTAMANQEKGLEPKQLNIAILLVRTSPPAGTPVTAEWVCDNYDHEAAERVLLRLKKRLAVGPYLVSAAGPLSSRTAQGPYLYQDLSWVTPKDAQDWVDEFLNQAGQERFWEARTMARLALNVRTVVSILAQGLSMAQTSLPSLILLVKE